MSESLRYPNDFCAGCGHSKTLHSGKATPFGDECVECGCMGFEQHPEAKRDDKIRHAMSRHREQLAAQLMPFVARHTNFVTLQNEQHRVILIKAALQLADELIVASDSRD